MTAQAHPNLTDAPALVVFGRDKGGKPHALQIELWPDEHDPASST